MKTGKRKDRTTERKEMRRMKNNNNIREMRATKRREKMT